MDIKTDQESGLPYVEVGGYRRVLGALPPHGKENMPKFSASAARTTIPRSSWVLRGFGRYRPEIYDQNGHNSCVGNGSAGGFGAAWRIAGNAPRRFSSGFIYAGINGNRDQGANVSDACERLRDVGCCEESFFAQGNIWLKDISKDAKTNATRFKIAQAYALESFEEIVSAIMQGFIVVFGVEIGSAFEPDSKGFIPQRRGRGGGHCMYTDGLIFNSKNDPYLEVPNSWGTRWGFNGVCYMPESYFTGSYIDAYAIEAPGEDPEETNLPPKILA